jgi:outer membrane protein assembly factor BamB
MDNILFIETTKNTNEAVSIYGLDILTGKVIWELHYQIPYKTGFVARNFNKETNLCYGYGGKFYQVFDPIKGEMLLSKDMTEYYEQGISPNSLHNTISDGRLWFVSGEGRYGDRNSKFGAINLETSEIEFIQDYSFKKGGMADKPIFYNGKLYLLDKWNKELHIFE